MAGAARRRALFLDRANGDIGRRGLWRAQGGTGRGAGVRGRTRPPPRLHERPACRGAGRDSDRRDMQPVPQDGVRLLLRPPVRPPGDAGLLSQSPRALWLLVLPRATGLYSGPSTPGGTAAPYETTCSTSTNTQGI